MRLLLSLAVVLSMTSTEIERAQQVARSRDSEREQFHRRYVFELRDPAVTQIEVVTEFRRLVLLTEDHIRQGDWLFSRSVRSAEQALAPYRGIVTLKGVVRFNPLNTFITSPPYVLAIGVAAERAPVAPLDTQVSPQYSIPFKARDGKMVSSLAGATVEAQVPAAQMTQTGRTVAVILDGRELARTTVEFTRLD